MTPRSFLHPPRPAAAHHTYVSGELGVRVHVVPPIWPVREGIQDRVPDWIFALHAFFPRTDLAHCGTGVIRPAEQGGWSDRVVLEVIYAISGRAGRLFP